MARVGKYELLEEIGRGGYGTVHKVHDPSLGIDRAIKILHPILNTDPEFILRFRREARLVAQLRHPNIIPIIELDKFEGSMYLVMDYMSGGSLRTRLKAGAMSFEDALALIHQIGGALAYAHEKGVIHRDIKPENILFDENGSAYLCDFGFARSLAEASTSTSMSLTGGVLGTPAYMAPEAWEGKGWSPAADVYSLGCVFVEMLSGEILFSSSSPVEAMKKHVIDGAHLPAEWPADVPAGFEAVIQKSLAKDVEDRFETVRDLIDAVDAAAASKDRVLGSAAVPRERPGPESGATAPPAGVQRSSEKPAAPPAKEPDRSLISPAGKAESEAPPPAPPREEKAESIPGRKEAEERRTRRRAERGLLFRWVTAFTLGQGLIVIFGSTYYFYLPRELFVNIISLSLVGLLGWLQGRALRGEIANSDRWTRSSVFAYVASEVVWGYVLFPGVFGYFIGQGSFDPQLASNLVGGIITGFAVGFVQARAFEGQLERSWLWVLVFVVFGAANAYLSLFSGRLIHDLGMFPTIVLFIGFGAVKGLVSGTVLVRFLKSRHEKLI